jgi:hypothetical protein
LEVREQIEQWRIDYNTDRPHISLGYSSPIKFAEEHYKRLSVDISLYPKNAKANHSLIEESRLVDKVIEKQKISTLEITN